MDTRLHLHVTAGFAVLSIGAAVAVPALSPAVARPVESDAVALVAQAQPLSLTPAAIALSPPGLIGQQVAFHVVFVTDFLVTGAQLFARELPIPLTLAADLAGRTPLPTAVARALQNLAAVEVDAGNELLRFGAEYVRFQAQFVTNLIPSQVAVAPTATPAPRTFVGSAPRTVVESALPAPTPTTIALTHRSKPRDEASPPVPSKPEPPVDTDEPKRGSAGSTTEVDRKDGSRDSHVPRRDRLDRRSAEGPSTKGSDAQATRHDGPDRHDRKPDGPRRHRD
ncbi:MULTISPECIES: hypothetical protein [unclassified Mycobacterium]|uniref:hypothetical protein n=1 Tax=unclassified Mycobacterium TaxID=2642494 RepID=UPI0029C7F784|nr:MULTISPECIES: hypothetical protein [unclassified Mycobacterium]